MSAINRIAMKFKFLCISTLVLGVLLHLSCSKECNTTDSIDGEWLWTISTGTWGPFTPEEAGYTETLFIDEFYFKKFHNDSLVFESQYDLFVRTDTIRGYVYSIQFTSGLEFVFSIEDEELKIIDYRPDGFTDHYIRN